MVNTEKEHGRRCMKQASVSAVSKEFVGLGPGGHT